jgi:hypothetical protein
MVDWLEPMLLVVLLYDLHGLHELLGSLRPLFNLLGIPLFFLIQMVLHLSLLLLSATH